MRNRSLLSSEKPGYPTMLSNSTCSEMNESSQSSEWFPALLWIPVGSMAGSLFPTPLHQIIDKILLFLPP